MYRVYATEGSTTIEGIVIATSDELMYTRTTNSFAFVKRGTNDYNLTADYTEFGDKYGNPFADANAFETYLATIPITNSITVCCSSSEFDGGSASTTYLIAQIVEGGSANSIYLASQLLNGGGA